MLKFLTIRNRIYLTFALLSSLSFYYFSNWVVDSSRQHYLEAAEEVLVDELILLKNILESETALGASSPNVDSFKKYYKNLKENEYPAARIYSVIKKNTDQAVYVTDSLGKVIFSTKNESEIGQNFISWRNVALALEGGYGARSTRVVRDDPKSSVLHVSYPVKNGEKIIGSVTLVKPVKSLSVYLELAQSKVNKIAILTFLLLILCGFLLVRKIVNPIEKLTKYTELVGKGEKVLLPKLPSGELKILGETIAGLRQNLDGKKYIESYILSLTHELKSPIAAIKGAAELLEDELKGTEDGKKLLRNMSREAGRMGQMVNNLLLLSRLENVDSPLKKELVDLVVLVKKVVGEFEERFPERVWQVTVEENCCLNVEENLLHIALSNVLSNALEFSSGLVQVKLSKNEKSWVIEVVDEGCGIPDYALTRVNEKFFSLPRPNSGMRSSGLGLAIVEEVLEIHGGKFVIGNREDGKGVWVKLILPIG